MSNVLLLLIPAVLLNFSTRFQTPAATKPFHSHTSDLYDTSGIQLIAHNTNKFITPRIVPNNHVAAFVKSYSKTEAAFLQKMRKRGEEYFPIIEKVFDQYNLPLQLKYLAIVESKLQRKALSPAGALGLWQLMPLTARELGLRISGKSDERTHTYRSTVAAAKYLKSLYRQFDDWLLVMAAYNCGPGTVYKAIKKSGSRNYWVLQRFLPAESRMHVKRYIGMHYYFEGEGGLTTLTKFETQAWKEKIEAEEMLFDQDRDTVTNLAWSIF